MLLIFNFVEKLDYICKNKFKAPTIPLFRKQLLIFSCVLFQTFSMSRGKKSSCAFIRRFHICFPI